MERRKRLAWFSPLADALRSALVSRTLLPILARSYDIELFCDEADLSSAGDEPFSNHEVRHYLRAQLRHREAPFDQFVYIVEDDARSAFVERHLRLVPGAALFLDLNLQDLVLSRYRHSTGGTDVNKEFRSAHGLGTPPLGDYLVRSWPIEIFERFYPLGHDLLGLAPLRLLSTGARSRDLDGLPGRTERYFPPAPFVAPGVVAEERKIFRRMLEIDENELVVGFSGVPGLRSRAPLVLEALATLGESAPRFIWLVDPQTPVELYEQAIAKTPGASERVELLNARTFAELQTFHSIPDIWLLPQCDPERGAPLSALFALGRGVPLITSEVGFSESLPHGCGLTVSPGPLEREYLAAALGAVRSEGTLSVLRAAAARVRDELSPDRHGRLFSEALERNEATLRTALEIAHANDGTARSELIDRAGSADDASRERARLAARDFRWEGGPLR